MKWLWTIFLYGTLILSLFFLWENVLRSPCSRVIEYSIGAFDERFEISQGEFINQIELAEIPWETSAEKQLFRYVPNATFKVNLIWSEEQERLYEGDKLENTLDSRQNSLDSIQTRYQSAVRNYEKSVRSYETKLSSYEKEVSYWNEIGGAPQAQYQKLESDAEKLDRTATEVKTLLGKVNELADENNQKVDLYNDGVSEYNQLFTVGHEFDAGNTDGTEINVYSYDGIPELQTLLIHEFGHVLGIDHVDDKNSVMYYLLTDDNQKGELTHIDIEALQVSCRL
ncbi:MAG: hypothetical protein ACI870_000386 [Crocinitomicaceae bacterium]|jgi:hypothetical protein